MSKINKKLFANILYEFAVIVTIFLLIFYCLDNLYPGYVRYYFDLGYLMVIAMIAVGAGIIIDEEEDGVALPQITPKVPTLITLLVATIVGIMFWSWSALGIINQVAGFIAFLSIFSLAILFFVEKFTKR